MPNDRNIFLDDTKLMHLCEDYLHQVEQLKELSRKDPEQTPTPTKLIEILRYEGDDNPLTIEEYMELQHFIESGYADWKMGIIEQSLLGLLNEDGSKKDSLIFGDQQ